MSYWSDELTKRVQTRMGKVAVETRERQAREEGHAAFWQMVNRLLRGAAHTIVRASEKQGPLATTKVEDGRPESPSPRAVLRVTYERDPAMDFAVSFITKQGGAEVTAKVEAWGPDGKVLATSEERRLPISEESLQQIILEACSIMRSTDVLQWPTT